MLPTCAATWLPRCFEVLIRTERGLSNDHYLEVDYDLSDVMFVATSNSMNIPAPLLDRMEVIRLSGYTEDENRTSPNVICCRSRSNVTRWKKGELTVDDSAIIGIIRYYTREAGYVAWSVKSPSGAARPLQLPLYKRCHIEINGENSHDYSAYKEPTMAAPIVRTASVR